MTDTELVHERLDGVTAGVGRTGDVVHKVLTRRRDDVPAHRAASEAPDAWNYWKREAEALAEEPGP
jgi:hypothetical protein